MRIPRPGIFELVLFILVCSVTPGVARGQDVTAADQALHDAQAEVERLKIELAAMRE